MNRKQKRLVRIIAVVLAVLLGGGAIVSALISIAYAEEMPAAAPYACELEIEYLEEEQALRMSQRLVYTNASARALDRVVFYAPANLFRRLNSLPYDSTEAAAVFPGGYLPGGVDLRSLRVNGEEADYGFQGADEMFLRAACNLAPGESCTFEFDYYLLLTENAAFLGISDDGWRLSGFYFSPASLDESGEFILNSPLSFTRYVDSPKMDFSAQISLPEKYRLCATGAEHSASGAWTVRAEGVRDFSMVISKKLSQYTRESTSGVEIRLLSGVKKTADKVLDTAAEAIDTCEAWFGPLPFRQIDIVQTDYAPGSMDHSACLWLSQDVLKSGGWELAHTLRRFIAKQYFICSGWSAPVSDAWLSDSTSEFLAYLILEETDGHDAYLKALNDHLVDSLQLTIPGGLHVSSDASLFTAYEYDIVVRNRGAVVFHELYTAMGRDALLSGLGIFIQKGTEQEVLTEMDLVRALNEASGKSWEKFLTDWVFNVGDYVNQEIYWLE